MPLTRPTAAQRVASRALEITAFSIGRAMLDFEKWLVTGLGAAFALAVSKLGDLNSVVAPESVRLALMFLVTAIGLSVFVLLISTQLVAAKGASDEMEASLTKYVGNEEFVDAEEVRREMLRGQWWPASWSTNYTFDQILKGNHGSSARLVAKLSQAQTYLVATQVLFGVGSAFVMIRGIL